MKEKFLIMELILLLIIMVKILCKKFYVMILWCNLSNSLAKNGLISIKKLRILLNKYLLQVLFNIKKCKINLVEQFMALI